MTYQINYTGKDDGRVHCMFDIEYYMTQSDSGKWFSEIRCLPIVECLVCFLRDRLPEDGFNSERFIRDAVEIQETAMQLLLDVHNIHIEPTPYVTTEGFGWAYKVLRLECGTDMCVRKLMEKAGFDTKSEAVENAITKCLIMEL